MLTKIIISFLGFGLGLVMLVYTRQVVDFTGSSEFIDNWIGSGQTYSFIKILGAVIIFISFVYLLGDLDFLFNR
jgi:hypothetical protein